MSDNTFVNVPFHAVRFENNASNAVKILHENDSVAVVAGYGVVFGGRDLDGETFEADTDYRLDLVPNKPIYYDHAQNTKVSHQIGILPAIAVKVDDVGIWIQAELDKSAEYVDAVLELVKKGVMGLSSGTVAHLARRENGVIKTWPIVEWSLTATPAEPRTVGVERIKHLVDGNPRLKALLESAQESTNAEATAGEPGTEQDTQVREPIMEQENEDVFEDEEAAAPHVLTAADITEAVKAAVNPFMERLDQLEKKAVNPIAKAPSVSKTGLGDSLGKAIKWYVKTGDPSGFKAANDTIGNITTDADGGHAVPQAHYQGIIARRDESMIAAKLPVQRFGGKGTTLHVPLDGEADVEFAATAEQDDNYAQTYTRDMPVIGNLALTLAKKTKKVALTEELLEDEDSNLMAFLNNYVGRSYAAYHNYLLVTAAVAGGTAVTLDGTTLTQAEVPEVAWSLPDGYEDSTAWLMRKATAATIFAWREETSGGFVFDVNPPGSGANPMGPTLYYSPIHFSGHVAAIGGGAVSLIFGNFNYMALRDGALTFLRDPYTTDGIVYLKYRFRAAYGVLQAEAIRLATHPTS